MNYNQIAIDILRVTPDIEDLLMLACQTTMKHPFEYEEWAAEHVWKVANYLVEAEHTSILEHIVFTFSIHNVSRSFLAQITRHRMGSFTSSSQHYQNYSAYPSSVSPTYEDELESLVDFMKEKYEALVKSGIPIAEARQVLPNAMTIHLMWTVNLRSLLNFFRQRCCNRNTQEMQLFANRCRTLVLTEVPEMAKVIGPPCWVDKKCNQGHMKCQLGVWDNYDHI